MPRPRNPFPTPRCHKGRAVLDVYDNGARRTLPLGPWGSPEAEQEFARLLAELRVAGGRPASTDPTVNEVLVAFMRWALTYYRTPDGVETTEVGELKSSIKPLRELYGHTPAAQFGPKALAAVRQKMIDTGWCRSLVNRRVERVKRVFRWAASEELVPVTVYQGLRTLAGLRKGRTEARESEPVRPVDPTHVTATLPFLGRHLRAMIELQQVTGMRPGEVCKLKLAEVDRSGDLWFYRPVRHKTAHRGKDRVIPLGPRAQAVVVAFVRGDHTPPDGFDQTALNNVTDRRAMADAYQEAGRVRDAELLRDTAQPVVLVAGCVVDPVVTLFSPFSAREERFRQMRANRKSKVPPSQQNRRKAKPARVPAASYTPHTYTDAIAKAAKKAKVPHWHPNQIRHTFASVVRKAHGLEAAQVLLGHSKADVTQVYAERDLTLAAEVAATMG